ncbi:MAG: Glu-tRNA(Gln) amidotransferase subunit GatE [Candidatus Aenigmarchaeota archaeon]|nr:Glu-tRNA(Gln) amidotransferase subunit GatE [Candidatus Aenigmarchaeota archaeon]
MNYKEIGLRVGLEIHHSLDTDEKLFCSCPTLLKTKETPDFVLERRQIPVVGETGEIDVAAIEEMKKRRKIIYEVYEDCDCLVDTDEEPPHEINQEALEIALTIAELLNCKVVDEIQIMRKTIVDGSLPSGFQRTMLIGTDGWIETDKGKVEIEAISLEEDSGRLINRTKNSATFRLDRLGIPEVEVGTGRGIISPEHAKEVAKKIGNIIRSTGKAKIRQGSVRQDVNVSIKDGDRVEAKLVPSLSLIPVVIEKEIKRQQKLIGEGKKVSRDVRRVSPDGSTEFLRPLPGASRMYPETDVIPIRTKELLDNVRENLPETFSEKIKKYQKIGLSKNLAKQLVNSDYVEWFDKLVNEIDVNPTLIANIFANTLSYLESEGLDASELTSEDFRELFDLISSGEVMKESIDDVLRLKLKDNKLSIKECVDKLGIETISEDELRKIVREVISANPNAPKGKIIGFVMAKVRGKADPKDVIRIVNEELDS